MKKSVMLVAVTLLAGALTPSTAVAAHHKHGRQHHRRHHGRHQVSAEVACLTNENMQYVTEWVKHYELNAAGVYVYVGGEYRSTCEPLGPGPGPHAVDEAGQTVEVVPIG
jgi:hypothetical protein